jgi:hypothetical protein
VALSFLEFGAIHILRTLVYIDGLNLYHGCLKQLPHCRWLDIEKLATSLCSDINADTDIIGIKYFTAPILERLSPKGSLSAQALQAYVRALGDALPQSHGYSWKIHRLSWHLLRR